MRLVAFFPLTATASALRERSTNEIPGPAVAANTKADPRGITWTAAYTKANASLTQLSLEEKIGIVTGSGWQKGPCIGNTKAVGKIGFPALCLQDGPLGVRNTENVTFLPAGVHAASTWDVDLIRKRGYALGSESKALGVHIQLGPVAGPLGKIPHGGRNWEGFSPDPYLTGIAMQETIRGMQEAGVQANAKHFIGNEQELNRTTISSNIDDRTMHELYLLPFADAVNANVASIMCSYNKLNSTSACENDKVLTGLLKEELQFKGYVMSDWNAQHTTVASALAGMDMAMPGDDFKGGNILWGQNLTDAIPSKVPQSRLDDMVRRILASWYYLGQDSDYPASSINSWSRNPSSPNVQADHKSVARVVARDGIVLLKNDKGILPLKKPRSLAVVGLDSVVQAGGPNACPDRACNNGTIASGWGSGTAEFPYLSSPLEALTARAAQDNTTIFSSPSDNPINGTATAGAADIAIVFINSDAGEEYLKVEGQSDRLDLNPWHEGNELVTAVATTQKPTVVVIHSVGPIILEKILEHPNVLAIVWAGLPGQESGNALVDVLFGVVAPSGKLPYTIAKQESDYGTGLKINGTDDFEEGIYVDYRQFDKAGIEPRYEFGFGLSYATFAYSKLLITSPELEGVQGNSSELVPTMYSPTGDRTQASLYASTGHKISVTLTNTGTVDGAEVPQLYVAFPKLPGVDFPPWQLRGFQKVFLKAGESKVVTFTLRRKDLSYWDVRNQAWTVVPGDITLRVAGSSRLEGVKSLMMA